MTSLRISALAVLAALALTAAAFAVWSWASGPIVSPADDRPAASVQPVPVPLTPAPLRIPPVLVRTAPPIPPGRSVVLTAVPYIDRGPR